MSCYKTNKGNIIIKYMLTAIAAICSKFIFTKGSVSQVYKFAHVSVFTVFIHFFDAKAS